MDNPRLCMHQLTHTQSLHVYVLSGNAERFHDVPDCALPSLIKVMLTAMEHIEL